LFDKVLNHCMFFIKKQHFLQIDDEAETKKSLCIDLIFFHMNYHVHQCKEFSFVLRIVFIDVVAHNIFDNILHQLLSLFIQNQFNELRQDRLTRLQRSFRHCKLLIIDEKFMIDLLFLYKLNCRLRAIYAEFDRFFDEMNIMLCDDFAQLSFVENISMYFHSRHFNSKLLMTQTIYRAFDQFIFLTKSMRQNENSSTVQQFRETLIEMRDESIFLINWQFLQIRSRKRLIFQKWANFTHAFRLYARNINFVKYNLKTLKRLNCSMLKIYVNHQKKKRVKDSMKMLKDWIKNFSYL
jgi:hypothetical protein